MPLQFSWPLSAAVALVVMAVAGIGTGGGGHPEKVVAELKPVPDGGFRRLNASFNRVYPMSVEKPEGVKKGIDDPSARYAVIPTRVTDKGLFVAVTESDDSKTGRIYLDLNGDGDLTNDPLPDTPAARWTRRGPAAFQADLDVQAGGHTVRLSFFRYTNDFAKGKESFEKQGNPLFVHRDDVREGKLALGGVSYPVLLKDMAARGRYDDLTPVEKRPAVALFIDRDGDGAYDPDCEQYDLAKPFALGGVTYELDEVAADGSRLAVRRSAKAVPEVPMLPTVIGRPAPRFKAKLLGGGEVNFPDDFKGKVVLLDFWATWCGPCMVRKPALVRTHDRVKDAGVVIVGICLDGAEDRDAAAAACKKHGMVWPQAFDGLGVKGEVARMYGVDALPTAFLVDGTTGRVLAPPAEAGDADKAINRVLAIRDALRGK